MQKGDFRRAVQVLRHATEYMKDSIDTPEVEQQRWTLPMTPGHLLQYVVPVATLPLRLTQDEGGLFDVFQCAFRAPFIPGDEWEIINQSRASVTNLYNMALAHHQQGLSRGYDSSRNLKLARNLYKMALSVVETIQPDLSSDHFMLLLTLAVFNNMGQISASWYDEAETKKCIRAVTSLTDSHTVHAAMQSEASDIFSFFRLGGVVYRLITGSSCFAIAPQA